MGYMECRHIKSDGCKCKAPALCDKPYCYFHARLHRTLHAAKAESASASGAASDAAIEVPAIEDRTAVRFALTQVLQALASKRLEPRRASQLLYGLQIASQLVERDPFIFSSEYVQSLAADEEGDELAPKKYVCREEDDCDECPYVDNCTHFVTTDEEDSDGDAADEDGEESEASDDDAADEVGEESADGDDKDDRETDDDKLVRKALALLGRSPHDLLIC
ncbi:MAG TPA: hypothetical protein VJX73_12680 [Terracidiphilus sp.]|nr:hypothetical protein [Terracidiphilus sp.]